MVKKKTKPLTRESSLLKRFQEERRVRERIAKLTPQERTQFEEFKARKVPPISMGEQLRRTRPVQEFEKFAALGAQEPDFSQEQMALKEIMSGGSINKIWGFNNEPVKLNFDLNPRRRGDIGTGELFGLNY